MDHKHGWSKQKPTVYINGERDRIELQSGKIRANILFPSLAQGIVPFINQFGRLWIGTLTQSFFEKKFHYERNLFVTNLESLKDVTSDQYILQKEKNIINGLPGKVPRFTCGCVESHKKKLGVGRY
jgi:hypothetical protein